MTARSFKIFVVILIPR